MMKRRDFLKYTAATAALGVVEDTRDAHAADKPNVVLIVADDLGYNELGCYGQEKIKTPHLDRLAAQGMRFTQFYSGQAVCAPSRCSLLTGKHMGHAYIRTNYEVQPEGQLPIPPESWTMAEMFKAQGYATAAIGKWGLGPPGSSGDPNKQGFDFFYGYNCQRHAHNYYPRYLYRNDQREPLPGNDRGLTGEHYAPDLMLDEALKFIEKNQETPFFLYYPTPVPHLALQVPEDSLEQYKGQWEDPPYDGSDGYLPHEHPRAAYAAMITRMDRDIGQILDQLKQSGLEENTLVICTSDNGPTYLEGPDTEFFDSNGPLRGWKGSLYEGGIRVPLIARWPGKIAAGSENDHISAFWDLLPTFANIIGGETKGNVDGLSLHPELLGQPHQPQHDYLYWEFPSYGGQQAVRMGRWKGVRQNLKRDKGNKDFQLYDLQTDLGEQNDLAGQHPEVLQKIKQIAEAARVPSEPFPFPALDN